MNAMRASFPGRRFSCALIPPASGRWRSLAAALLAALALLALAPRAARAASPLAQDYFALRTLYALGEEIKDARADGTYNDDPGLQYLNELFFPSGNPDLAPIVSRRQAFQRGALAPHTFGRVPVQWGAWDYEANDAFVHAWETANFYARLIANAQRPSATRNQDLEAFALGALAHYRAELRTNAITAKFAGGVFGETGTETVPRWDATQGLPIRASDDQPYDPIDFPDDFPLSEIPFAAKVRERHFLFESWVTAWMLDTEGAAAFHPDGYERDLNLYVPPSYTTDEIQLLSLSLHDLYDSSGSSAGMIPDPSMCVQNAIEFLNLQVEALKGNVGSSLSVSDPFLASALNLSRLETLWRLPTSEQASRFVRALGAPKITNLSPGFATLAAETLAALKDVAPGEAVVDMLRVAPILKIGRASEITLADVGVQEVNLYDGKVKKTLDMPRIPRRKTTLLAELTSLIYMTTQAPSQILMHGLQPTGLLSPVTEATVTPPVEPGSVYASPRGREAVVLGFSNSQITRLFNSRLASFNPVLNPTNYTMSLPGSPKSACYFPDGRRLAILYRSGKVVIRDTLADLTLNEFPVPLAGQMAVQDIAIDPSSETVYVLISNGSGLLTSLGFVYVIQMGETPVFSMISLCAGQEPHRIVYDPTIDKLVILATGSFRFSVNRQQTIVFCDPRTGASEAASPNILVWASGSVNKVVPSLWWNWILEEQTVILLPISIMLCGLGTSALMTCMVNILIVETLDMTLLSVMNVTIRYLHSIVYVLINWDPLSIDWFGFGICTALSLMGGPFVLQSFLIGMLIGQLCNFSAKTRAQATYLDVFKPVDIGLSPVKIPSISNSRITAAVVAERSGNVGIMSDDLMRRGASNIPQLNAATVNMMGNEHFGAGFRERGRVYGRTTGYAVAVDQVGGIIAARAFMSEGGAKRQELLTLWRPKLDQVLFDTATHLPQVYQLRAANRRFGGLSFLSLSPRPAGDWLRYTSVPSMIQVTLTLGTTTYPNLPLGYELYNSDLANFEQKLPAYDAGVERIHTDPMLFNGAQRVFSLAARPTFTLRHTNLFAEPYRSGVVLEVEGRRPIEDIALYVAPPDQPYQLAPASDYEWAYRDQEKRLVRIAIPEMRDLPGMGFATRFRARVDITHDNPSPLVPPVTLSLFTNGNLGEAPETVSGQIDLEMVDVNQDLVRFMFTREAGGAPFYPSLILPLNMTDLQQPSRVVCDGVSLILLRAKAKTAGTVTFQILPGDRKQTGVGASQHHQNGTIRDLETALNLQRVTDEIFDFGPAEPEDRLTVDTQQLGGEHWAFALYCPPEDFARFDVTTNQPLAEDRLLSERPIVFTASFEPDDPEESSANTSRPALLSRKPLIFVHDIGGRRENWNSFGRLGRLSATHPGYPDPLRIYLDYSVTGMECFDNNTQILADQTKAALEDLREAGYAVARADVVAHGVGGVLARMWATGEGPVYHTQETFKQGAVHRLIAIGSPFQGSPLGNFAANFGRGLSGSAMDAVYNAVSGSFAAPADNTRPGELFFREFAKAMTNLSIAGGERGAVVDLSMRPADRPQLHQARIKVHTVALTSSLGQSESTEVGVVEGDGVQNLWRLISLGYQDDLEADHVSRMLMQPTLTAGGATLHLIDRYQAFGNWGASLIEHDDIASWQSHNAELGQIAPARKECTSQVQQSHFKALESNAVAAPGANLPDTPAVAAGQFFQFSSAELATVQLLDIPLMAGAFADSMPDLTMRWGAVSPFVRSSVSLPNVVSGCGWTAPILGPQGIPPANVADILLPASGSSHGAGSYIDVQIRPKMATAKAYILVSPVGILPLPADESSVKLNLPNNRGGAMTLSVLALDNGGYVLAGPQVTVNITGGSPRPLAVEVGESRLKLSGPGAKGRISTTIIDMDGEWIPAPGDPSVVFTSSNTSVAEVDASGVIQAIAPGEAVITVQSGGASAEALVIVKEPSEPAAAPAEPSEIQVNP